MNALKIAEYRGGCLFPVKVSPGAAKSAVAGLWADHLKVMVRAQPERGKANEEVVSLLADLLNVSPSCIAIVRGQSSPKKTVQIAGLTPDEVSEKLREFLRTA